jgi:hypothetical protein
MKKILSLVLATAICVSAVACGDNAGTTTTDPTGGVGGTTTAITTAATTVPGTVIPDVDPAGYDPVTLTIAEHLDVIYNPAYCNITYKVEDGVGSRKKVTLWLEMKDGYVFDGWSYGKAIANGGKSETKNTTYTITVSSDTTVYANYSAQLVYHPNGGSVVDGGETYTQKFSVVGYKCPNTLPEQNYFSRKGYTLIEYNTKADGTGEAVSLGSKIAMDETGVKELYCIWEKQNEAADFETTSVSGGVAITKYVGTATNVIIPDAIGSKKVVAINEGAFEGLRVERVVLSKNVKTVEENAFKNCKKLASFVMFDSVEVISDDSFNGALLKNLRINAVLNLYNNWTVGYAAPKMDRLIWAKANGKKVIAIYGGSGSLFGWKCDMIEEALGNEYVVVNLGTNANATATMFFDCFDDMLEKDDVVLWAPEPGEWTLGSTAMGTANSWYSSANPKSWEINAAHYDIFKYMDISKYSMVFDSYADYASAHASAQKAFDAFADDVDCHGDADALNKEPANGGGYSYRNEYERRESLFEDNTLNHMAKLIAALDAKGVKVFHTYAAMDENGKDSIDYDYMTNTFEKVFEEKFKGIEMISDIKDCFVPSSQMRDSAWHLTRKGAETRTKVVIEDLKAALGK